MVWLWWVFRLNCLNVCLRKYLMIYGFFNRCCVNWVFIWVGFVGVMLDNWLIDFFLDMMIVEWGVVVNMVLVYCWDLLDFFVFLVVEGISLVSCVSYYISSYVVLFLKWGFLLVSFNWKIFFLCWFFRFIYVDGVCVDDFSLLFELFKMG